MVKRVLIKLITENNLQKQFFDGEVEVTLVHNDTIMMFMNLDQRFFLTIPILQLTDMNEERLAVLLSHELAHYLLDH